jgi:hypothetical protein
MVRGYRGGARDGASARAVASRITQAPMTAVSCAGLSFTERRLVSSAK